MVSRAGTARATTSRNQKPSRAPQVPAWHTRRRLTPLRSFVLEYRQAVTGDEARVGIDDLTLLEHENIARHDFGGGHTYRFAVARDPRLGHSSNPQCSKRRSARSSWIVACVLPNRCRAL